MNRQDTISECTDNIFVCCVTCNVSDMYDNCSSDAGMQVHACAATMFDDDVLDAAAQSGGVACDVLGACSEYAAWTRASDESICAIVGDGVCSLACGIAGNGVCVELCKNICSKTVDVLGSSSIARLLQHVQEWDVVFITHSTGRTGCVQEMDDTCTSNAYIVTPQGARKLCEAAARGTLAQTRTARFTKWRDSVRIGTICADEMWSTNINSHTGHTQQNCIGLSGMSACVATQKTPRPVEFVAVFVRDVFVCLDKEPHENTDTLHLWKHAWEDQTCVGFDTRGHVLHGTVLTPGGGSSSTPGGGSSSTPGGGSSSTPGGSFVFRERFVKLHGAGALRIAFPTFDYFPSHTHNSVAVQCASLVDAADVVNRSASQLVAFDTLGRVLRNVMYACSTFCVNDAYYMPSRSVSAASCDARASLTIAMDATACARRVMCGTYVKKILCFYVGYSFVYDEERMREGVFAYHEEAYGSEIALCELAFALSSHYVVYVLYNQTYAGHYYGGVHFMHVDEFVKNTGDMPIDTLIVSRYIEYFIERALNARRLVLWVHDTQIINSYNHMEIRDRGAALMMHVQNTIACTVLQTPAHARVYFDMYPLLPRDRIKLIGNGFDHVVFDAQAHVRRIQHRFIWTSSFDRGIERAVAIIHELRKHVPDVHLCVCRGYSVAKYYQFVRDNTCEYIEFLGKVDRTTLAAEFMAADVWFYPTHFYETFCISALEAQYAGCICITSKVGALVDTVGNRGLLLDQSDIKDTVRAAMLVRYALVQKSMPENAPTWDAMRAAGRAWAKQHTWDARAQQWQQFIQSLN